MHLTVFEIFAALPKKIGNVYPWRDRHAVYRWLRPLCKRLNVRFTPHMARHDFASTLNEYNATSKDICAVSITLYVG